MTMGQIIGAWIQPSNIWIVESEYTSDAHDFVITIDDKYISTIYADTLEEIEGIRVRLNAEEDVRGWADSNGDNVGMLINQRTAGLRETIRVIENAGRCYSGELRNGKLGTYWVDNDTGTLYEYETDNEALNVDDLTEEDLDNIMIEGL